MTRNKKIVYYLTLIPLILIIILFSWLFTVIFEGEQPFVKVSPLPQYLSQKQAFQVDIEDTKRGIRALKISYSQGSSEVVLLEMRFPFEGLMNKYGTRQFGKTFEIDPGQLRLAQGRLDLIIQVWDYSRRNGGDGNMNVIKHSMIIDSIPPAVRAVSRMHNVNIGGTGLVIYKTSSDTIESGVYVNKLFFKGFPAEAEAKDGISLAYFALPFDIGTDPEIYLWAKDRAGNTARATFYYKIISKKFRSDKLNISDSFFKKVLPYFDYYGLDPALSDKDNYLKINRELRVKDNNTIYEAVKNTSALKLWDDVWLRMKNAAETAKFADHRSYLYNGEIIDEQFHMGIDLASLANSPIEAANSGTVVFAERNGIYGLTVILDHGQGIASLYGHLDSIDVKVGDSVKRGDILGVSGQTGLAGGDHLHFSVIVHGVFVNPIEWWDPHWIKDNVTLKLELIKQEQ
ncbi:MAG: M23 family metallopeptidase [Desulfatiglans sp.]|nr:M23 family metallopeptidase [Desulfatiglans sp.]